MPAGDRLRPDQRAVLVAAVASAEQVSGLRFRVRLGVLDGRAQAEGLLSSYADAASTVLVAIDPAHRRLEIVTGSAAAQRLDDRACGLAALTMTSSFQAGDLVGGLRNGLRLLGDHARARRVAHLDTL